MFKSISSASILSAAALILSTTAHAVDGNLPGSACQPVDGAYASFLVGGNGGVLNTSTTTALNVNCPIPGYYPANISAEVSVQKHNNASMTCSVVGRNFDNSGGTLKSLTKNYVGFNTFYINTAQGSAFNSVKCTIPKAVNTSRTRINGYSYYLF